MSKYPKLKYAFNHFAAYTEETINEYRKDFEGSVKSGHIEPDILRQEIETSFKDQNFSWVELAKEEDFIYYREGNTKNQIFESFKFLTWDLLFPDEVMSKEEMKALYNKVMQILKSIQHNEGWLLKDELIKKLIDDYPTINTYELLRMNRDIAKGRIKIKRDEQDRRYFRANE